MGKKNKYNNKGDVIKSNVGKVDNNSGVVNQIQTNNGVVKNNVHIDNSKHVGKIYNYKRVYNAVSKVPDVDDGYRGMLSAIENETHSAHHMFSGFVNYINTRKNTIVVCNIFWNNDVYVCNHINHFGGPRDKEYKELPQREIELHLPACDVRVGDFIIFKGIIGSYTRKSDGTEDKSIVIEEITDCVPRPEILCPDILVSENKEYYHILHNMDKDMMKRFYDIQINRIRFDLEDTKYFKSEMYEAMLQTVLYEGTHEHDMIKNQLKLAVNDMNKRLVKGVALLRYLVTELDRTHSPHIINTFMNRIIKSTKNNIPTYYDKAVRCFSDYKYTLFDDDYVAFVNKEYKIALNYYLKEFDDIMKSGNFNNNISLKRLSLVERLYGNNLLY